MGKVDTWWWNRHANGSPTISMDVASSKLNHFFQDPDLFRGWFVFPRTNFETWSYMFDPPSVKGTNKKKKLSHAVRHKLTSVRCPVSLGSNRSSKCSSSWCGKPNHKRSLNCYTNHIKFHHFGGIISRSNLLQFPTFYFSPPVRWRLLGYVSCPARLLLLLRLTSTASSWSQWSPPETNSKPRIRVHTSSASSWSQWSPPDPNSKPASECTPQLQAASSWSQWSPPDPNSKPRIRVFSRRTSTASSWSQWSPPDPNSKPRIRVFTAGPQLQARDCSGPRRTRTANPGSVCSPPDLNCKLVIAVVPAGPQPQRISEDIPDRMQEKMSEDMPDTYARKNVR